MDEIINTQQQSDCGEKLVLRTEGLVKRYGKRTVANGVTINVKQGEIVGLLGPNGAGKTTSFYMTTGLLYLMKVMSIWVIRILPIILCINVPVLVSVICLRRQVSFGR